MNEEQFNEMEQFIRTAQKRTAPRGGVDDASFILNRKTKARLWIKQGNRFTADFYSVEMDEPISSISTRNLEAFIRHLKEISEGLWDIYAA